MKHYSHKTGNNVFSRRKRSACRKKYGLLFIENCNGSIRKAAKKSKIWRTWHIKSSFQHPLMNRCSSFQNPIKTKNCQSPKNIEWNARMNEHEWKICSSLKNASRIVLHRWMKKMCVFAWRRRHIDALTKSMNKTIVIIKCCSANVHSHTHPPTYPYTLEHTRTLQKNDDDAFLSLLFFAVVQT